MQLELKQIIVEKCLAKVQVSISQLSEQLLELQEDLQSAQKSTAGDKHETSRAMLHLEIEKLQQQKALKLTQLEHLQKANTQKVCKKVEFLALFKTLTHTYFILEAIGPVKVKEEQVFVISLKSPLAQKMLHKAPGDSIELNGKTHKIISII